MPTSPLLTKDLSSGLPGFFGDKNLAASAFLNHVYHLARDNCTVVKSALNSTQKHRIRRYSLPCCPLGNNQQ